MLGDSTEDNGHSSQENHIVAAWEDDSWKREDAASGWNNEEDGWDLPEQDLNNVDGNVVLGTGDSFLMKKLGLGGESIFDGPKTLTG